MSETIPVGVLSGQKNLEGLIKSIRLWRAKRRVLFGESIHLILWRRGRGRVDWRFEYVLGSHEPWYTTPGWYHKARKNVFRLTIDHDYPHKPLWLGMRKDGVWHNAETLYTPLSAIHHNLLIQSRDIEGKARSSYRQRKTREILRKVAETTFKESSVC